MVPTNPERASYFPAIERKHGLPMAHWFEVMATIKDRKYADQVAYLRENHGFSQAHANALVLYSRGNTTSRRFDTLDDYLAGRDDTTQATVRAIFAPMREAHPAADIVIAWNQPMLKLDGAYLFGVSVLTNHILIAPWGAGVIAQFTDRLSGYKVNKKTIQVPLDWIPDSALLLDMVQAAIAAATQAHRATSPHASPAEPDTDA